MNEMIICVFQTQPEILRTTVSFCIGTGAWKRNVT